MRNLLDFYEILDIPKNSSHEEIREAYKILAMKWHPDKHPPSSKLGAEAKFKSITQAYDALHNIQKSRNYQKPEKEQEMPLPKYATTPGKNFKDSANSNGTSENFKDFNFSDKASPMPNHARTPGRDFKYFCHSTAASSPAPQGRSFSGQVRRKPPPEERKLECTLEELFQGCVKELKLTRDVVGKNGEIAQKQETETIRVKPGWKKGIKITFEGMGNEQPGYLPSDVVFLITEKEHPVFKRVGNNLVLTTDVPLVDALTGWTFSFRLITGEKTTCTFDNEIIYPGYEKVIRGEGMPIASEKGKRGDLVIKFRIVFPTKLSSEQRSGIVKILKGTTSSCS